MERLKLEARTCTMLGCKNRIDITSSSLKRTNKSIWHHCKGVRCTVWCCPEHVAYYMLQHTKKTAQESRMFRMSKFCYVAVPCACR